MDIVEKIKLVLRIEGIKAAQLAASIGKSQQGFSNYMQRKTKIDIETLRLIAKELNKPLSFFLEDNENEQFKANIETSGNENKIVIGNQNFNSESSEVQMLKQRILDLETHIEVLNEMLDLYRKKA